MGSRIGFLRREEPLLWWTGLAGLLEAGVIALIGAVRGWTIPPEGDLVKPIEAYLTLAVLVLTTAALLPMAELDPRIRRAWRGIFLFCVWYSYVWEITQHSRGFDPRHSWIDGPVNHAFRWVYFSSSQAYVALYALLAWRFFRGSPRGRPLLGLGIRYGSASFLCGTLLGYLMIYHWVWHDRRIVHTTAVTFGHIVGFHGLQAVPLVALLLERAPVREATARALVHSAGAFWLAAEVMLMWQTLSGRTTLEPTGAIFSCIALAAGFALVCGAAALLAGRRARSDDVRALPEVQNG